MMKEIIQTLREQSIVSDGKLRCNTSLTKGPGIRGGGGGRYRYTREEGLDYGPSNTLVLINTGIQCYS